MKIDDMYVRLHEKGQLYLSEDIVSAYAWVFWGNSRLGYLVIGSRFILWKQLWNITTLACRSALLNTSSVQHWYYSAKWSTW